MKDIFKAVSDILLGDSDLKVMCKYTSKKMNIRRAFVPKGEWDTLVIYYRQAEAPQADFCSQIRNARIIVSVYDRKSDLLCEDVGERIILLLDGADLDVSGNLFVYDCSYEGELIPVQYNDKLKSFERLLQFKIVYRVDEVTGTSGYPERKRKRDHA